MPDGERDGPWPVPDASAAILVGGRSLRMGRDKSQLLVQGWPLIARIHESLRPLFAEILLGGGPGRDPLPGTRTIPDPLPGLGPLMGICAVVTAASSSRVFVTACDIPDPDPATVRRLLALAEGCDCAAAATARGPEPLFAVYAKSALPEMRAALRAGDRRIRALLPRLRTRLLPLGEAPWFRNLNTPEDLAAYLEAPARGAGWAGASPHTMPSDPYNPRHAA